MQKYTRLATEADLDKIMMIIAQAKAFLKKAGSSQWQDGYPDRQDILNDIRQHYGYVFVAGNDIAAYAAVIVGMEPTYQEIAGQWRNEHDQYATIHRICFSSAFQGQGLAKIFISNLISLKYAAGVHNFRVDTHAKNLPMQYLAAHNGFSYRGIIKVFEDKECPERLAYELNLE